MASPLDGVRIVEMANYLPGPYATLMMVQMGAEVIKVERPIAGDLARGQLRVQSNGHASFTHLFVQQVSSPRWTMGTAPSSTL